MPTPTAIPVPQPPSSLEVLNQLNTIYSSFNAQLVNVLVATFLIAAVFVPLLIAALQALSAKREKKQFEELISTMVTEEIRKATEISEKLFQELKKEITQSVEKEIWRVERGALAGALLIQANNHFGKNAFGAGMDNNLQALSAYVDAKQEQNVRACLNNVDNHFNKINKVHVKDFKLEKCTKSAIDSLRTINQNDRYRRDIDALERALERAKEREPLTAAQPPGA